MPYVTDLPAALRARGLKVELVPGWETRGSEDFNPYGSVSHWTAGPRTGDRASLHVCTYGRPGLSGPLCNVFLPRSDVVIVVAAGRANHAGKGGIGGLVGNSSVFGTEAENSGNGEWTDFQRWAYPRINAAYVDLGAKPGHVYGHHEWAPTRKVDIRDYTMDRMRREVAALLAGEQEDDVRLDAEDYEKIKALLENALGFVKNPATGEVVPVDVAWGSTWKYAYWTFLAVDKKVPADVDEAEVARVIAESMPDDLARQVADELSKRLES